MPDAQQHIASLRARFTSGNETPVEKAVVPAIEVAAVLAHIEALEANAARLDWLDAQNARFRIGWRVGQAPIGNVNVHAIVQLGTGPLTSIRAAIDAAMKENDHA